MWEWRAAELLDASCGAMTYARDPEVAGEVSGRYVTDYADLRVSCEACQDQYKAVAAIQFCVSSIKSRGASLAAGPMATGGGKALLGVLATGAGALLAATPGGGIVGFPLMGIGLGVAAAGISDAGVALEIRNAAARAIDWYCNCENAKKYLWTEPD